MTAYEQIQRIISDLEATGHDVSEISMVAGTTSSEIYYMYKKQLLAIQHDSSVGIDIRRRARIAVESIDQFIKP